MKTNKLIPFVGLGKIRKTAMTPKTGIGVGTCADVRRTLNPRQQDYLFQRGKRRVQQARAVMMFHAETRLKRLRAILKAVMV